MRKLRFRVNNRNFFISFRAGSPRLFLESEERLDSVESQVTQGMLGTQEQQDPEDHG